MRTDLGTIEQNERAHRPQFQFLDDEGAPDANFALGSGYEFRMVNRDTGEVVLDWVTATVASAAEAVIEYVWQAADVATPGVFKCQFRYTKANGEPDYSLPLTIEIRANV